VRNILDIYNAILNKVTRIIGTFAGVLLFIPALMIFYEVIMRGVFNAPTEWSIEMSVYCVLVAGFLGMPITYLEGKHIQVDLLIAHLSYKNRVKLEIFTSIMGIVFCGIFFMEAANMSMLSLEINRTSPDTLRVPLWIPQASMPIGIGLLTLQFISTLLEDCYEVATGNYRGGTIQ
jgi:C4-dicarboxylate transporter DctQ subunit